MFHLNGEQCTFTTSFIQNNNIPSVLTCHVNFRQNNIWHYRWIFPSVLLALSGNIYKFDMLV